MARIWISNPENLHNIIDTTGVNTILLLLFSHPIFVARTAVPTFSTQVGLAKSTGSEACRRQGRTLIMLQWIHPCNPNLVDGRPDVYSAHVAGFGRWEVDHVLQLAGWAVAFANVWLGHFVVCFCSWRYLVWNEFMNQPWCGMFCDSLLIVMITYSPAKMWVLHNMTGKYW